MKSKEQLIEQIEKLDFVSPLIKLYWYWFLTPSDPKHNLELCRGIRYSLSTLIQNKYSDDCYALAIPTITDYLIVKHRPTK